MDGLVAGRHFFHQGEPAKLDDLNVAAASKNVHEWYQRHDSRRHAEAQLNALTNGLVSLTVTQSQR